MLRAIRKNLSARILAVLIVSVASITIGVIYLTYVVQKEEMLRELAEDSEELTVAIYSGMKYPMAVGDKDAVEKELLEIRETLRAIDVFVCDTDRTITFSSHEGTIKSRIDRYIARPDILEALDQSLRTGEQPGRAFEEKVSIRKYLINIYAIANHEACFSCHGSEKKVLGAIVVKQSTDSHYAAITDLRNKNLLISFFGIGAIVIVAHVLMARTVSRPIRRLAGEIGALPEKIAAGEALTLPDIRRSDEIGELQNSFYSMTIDLDEKSREIEHSRSELAKANRELEAFAYSVSHDLRAPLRNIDGFSKILLDDCSDRLDEKGKHYLRRVRNGTIRMSMLIDDMLSFSRIGRAELQLKPIDPSSVVKNVVDHLSGEIANRNAVVEVGPLPVIDCDPVLMQSLFTNLISNALKFTVDGSPPVVTVGFDRESMAIFVRDNGIGFDMQYHDKVFQVFQRLHLPEEYEGTGIGLAIVKRIVERHRGSVWAESQPGKGTTFYMAFPLIKEV